MKLEHVSPLGRAILIVLVVLVTFMLAYAVYVGLTPPESSEPVEPYNIQQVTPMLTVTESP
jgi:hypothetical protein